VRAIEKAGFECLVWRDVRHKVHANVFEWRPSLAEIILDDPLRKGLRGNGGKIGHPESTSHQRLKPFVRARGDPINHAVRERHVAIDPARQARIP
jgi:hypothetical protein